MRNLNLLSVTLIPVALALAVGCTQPERDRTGGLDPDRMDFSREAALTASTSCEDAEAQVRQMVRTQMRLDIEQLRRQWLEYGFDTYYAEGGMDGGGSTGGDTGGDVQNASPTSSAATSPNYSETNVQVEGVDEADLVKTDGKRLFTLSGQDLVIVKSWPVAEAAELGRVTMRGYPHAMYLRGDTVVVLAYGSLYDFLSAEQQQAAQEESGYDWVWRGGTLVTTIDVSDGAKPSITEEMLYDGSLQSSRRIGDRLFLVQQGWATVAGLNYWPDIVSYTADASEINAAADKLIDANEAAIAKMKLTDWVPSRYALTGVADLTAARPQPLSDCTSIYQSAVHTGLGTLTAVTVNLSTGDATGSTVLGSWGDVYASQDALYVGSTNYSMLWWWGSVEEPEVTTDIHKFAFDGPGQTARYVASGRVNGTTVNQFAMDEYNGHFRIATTEGGWWGGDESESSVTVFEQSGARLKPVGHVGGLGKGERIYSVRFVGDRGYVVTFRQVDPLYVLDLSDPSRPAVTGELKIPGYSSYMHPMGDGHLLTVGRDGTDEGQVLGVSLRIFDVTDPRDPQETHKFDLTSGAWSGWSDAEYDHHAFTFYAAKGLLTIPVESWEDTEDYYSQFKSELRLLKIDAKTGISELGAISHDTLSQSAPQDNCYWADAYRKTVRRGVFVDDYVYSVSEAGVMAHHTDAVAEGALVSLPLYQKSPTTSDYDSCY